MNVKTIIRRLETPYLVCNKPVHVFRFCTVLQYPLRNSLTVHWSMSFLSTLQMVMNMMNPYILDLLGLMKTKA